VRLIEGNYEAYQQFLQRQAGEDDAEAAAANAKPGRSGKPPAKSTKAKEQHSKQSKRRFPFRKVADIEDEISSRETCVQELQRQLGQEEVCRNGNLVRQITADLAGHQEALKTLYAHWEEASELNW
jgi:ATP-binding cassette, subfamily F, member 3